MGKQLIIKGADFSANAASIVVPVIPPGALLFSLENTHFDGSLESILDTGIPLIGKDLNDWLLFVQWDNFIKVSGSSLGWNFWGNDNSLSYADGINGACLDGPDLIRIQKATAIGSWTLMNIKNKRIAFKRDGGSYYYSIDGQTWVDTKFNNNSTPRRNLAFGGRADKRDPAPIDIIKAYLYNGPNKDLSYLF